MQHTFIDRIYQRAIRTHGDTLGDLVIKDVQIGVHLAALQLSDESFGVASVIHSHDIHQVGKKDRDYGAFSPMHITGKKVSDLFGDPGLTATKQILKIACLHAIFQHRARQGGYTFIRNTDPIDLLELERYKNVVMVGAFHSYIDKMVEKGVRLRVLELDKKAFLPQHRPFYIPSDQYQEVLPEADLVIVTGLTLVNNTFDDLLTAISPESHSIVVGPSASLLPELFFDHHIDMLGGMLITRPERLFSLVSQGAAGYHLFDYCAEKITLCRE